jgi:endonuclease YncB( thermonuclease family)
MGTLIVSGVLQADQFWPKGRSDADTASVGLTIQNEHSFVFVDDAGKRHITKAFENAEVIGSHGRRSPVIKTSKKSGKRKVTIRMQGIDAPELHYQPFVREATGKGVVHPFRQSLGETSANALHAFVAQLGESQIPCEAVTVVSHPDEVCDTYGRVVANIVLTRGGSRIDLNHWLLREGWVLPAFYNSMLNVEILAVLADYKDARQHGRGLFSKNLVTESLAPFDKDRVEQKATPEWKPFDDEGPVNFPKFFRRQAEHFVRRAINQNVPESLVDFIATRPDDLALETDIFLKLKAPRVGSKPRPEFQQLAAFLEQNKFPIGPEIVFWEKDANLVKAGTNTEIEKW